MKNYRVEILPSAQSDIDGALDYIAVKICNPQAALALHGDLADCFRTLKQFPLAGTKLVTGMPLKRAYRWILVNRYVVFYTVDDTRQTVTVARVLFGSSDYLSALNRGEKKTD